MRLTLLLRRGSSRNDSQLLPRSPPSLPPKDNKDALLIWHSSCCSTEREGKGRTEKKGRLRGTERGAGGERRPLSKFLPRKGLRKKERRKEGGRETKSEREIGKDGRRRRWTRNGNRLSPRLLRSLSENQWWEWRDDYILVRFGKRCMIKTAEVPIISPIVNVDGGYPDQKRIGPFPLIVP